MMDNRGVSHIEIILSLVIFVGFLWALFFIINPFEVSESKVDFTEIIKNAVFNNLSANLSQVSIKINDTSLTYCAQIAEFKPGMNIRVKNESEAPMQAIEDNNGIYIRNPDGLRITDSGFFAVYISPEFSDDSFSTSSCTLVNPTNYTLGVYRNVESISYEKLLSLNKSYWEDYDNTKAKFGVPKGSDFGIVLYNLAREEVVKSLRSIGSGINVNAAEMQTMTLYKNGNLVPMRLKIFVY